MLKAKKGYVLITILLLVLVFVLLIQSKTLLIIEEAKTGNIIWQKVVTSGGQFAIEYLHSVERTPVWEYFNVRENQIFLIGTLYESYGAGLPFLKRHNYKVTNDKFEISNINYKLDNIPLRVSDYAKHKFIYQQEEYKLYDMTQAQNLIIIKVEDQNILRFMFEEAKLWLKRIRC